jgi:hypothetical protein
MFSPFATMHGRQPGVSSLEAPFMHDAQRGSESSGQVPCSRLMLHAFTAFFQGDPRSKSPLSGTCSRTGAHGITVAGGTSYEPNSAGDTAPGETHDPPQPDGASNGVSVSPGPPVHMMPECAVMPDGSAHSGALHTHSEHAKSESFRSA